MAGVGQAGGVAVGAVADHQGDAAGDRPRWDAAFWDERYGSSVQVWSGHVNAVVRDEAESLTPGRALDVGWGG